MRLKIKNIKRRKRCNKRGFFYSYFWQSLGFKSVKIMAGAGSDQFVALANALNKAAENIRKIPDARQRSQYIDQLDKTTAELKTKPAKLIKAARTMAEAAHDLATGFHTIYGTVAWIIDQYLKSADYRQLAPKTKTDYTTHLTTINGWVGDLQADALTVRVITAWRDSMSDKPHMANNALRVLSLLLSFGHRNDWLTENNAKKVKKLRTQRRRTIWTHEHEASFLAHAGNKIRLAFVLLAYTAQRPADILTMRWSQYNGQRIEVRQQKTGAFLWVPVHQKLKAELDKAAQSKQALFMVPSAKGLQWDYRRFSKAWDNVMQEAGLKGKGLERRDLRRTAMVRMAEAGCTAAEISAISGHSISHTEQILETYIPRTAKMAISAIEKLENHQPQSDEVVRNTKSEVVRKNPKNRCK